MIKEIYNADISMCYGGKGECHCAGTKDPAEIIFGTFRKITSDEVECVHWCVKTKGGTKWKFISNNDLISVFGFGGSWHDVGLPQHVKVS